MEDRNDVSPGNGRLGFIWRDFRDYTSLHGVNYVRRNSTYRCRWLVWTVSILVVVSFICVNVFRLHRKSMNYSTKTSNKIVMIPSVPFPAVTICNISENQLQDIQVDDVNDLDSHHHLDKHSVIENNNSDSSNSSDYDKDDTRHLNNYSLSDFFMFCSHNRKMIQCENYIVPKITQLGLCYTFNSYQYSQNNGQMYVETTGTQTALTFNMKLNQHHSDQGVGIRIVLHEPGEEPDVLNKGFNIAEGFSSYVSISMTKYEYLPSPYSISDNQHCIITKTSDFVSPLQFYPKYSYSACLMECRRNFIIQICTCRSVFDPGSEPVCTTSQSIGCYSQASLDFDIQYKATKQCNCQQPCEFVEYQYSISSAISPARIYLPYLRPVYQDQNFTGRNYLEVRLFFDSLSYTLVESFPEYSRIEVIGILGGMMALFLGASLLTLAEVAELFIMCSVIGLKNYVKDIRSKIANRR
ncbi:acid-sensing ion channel 1A-like [Mytilus californianus]|uniref:acid-sensing ion channel 1A-like n=1 Tax=Mytilus californianus TaxID=6549 RepID=UPI0022477AB7|nr:acid-sensing ion channel 1A-like [Mytilus californianus]